ncbi:MAG: hypothetical protein ABIH18_02030 [Candidatus Omnitrophota bacterium]
MFIDSAVKPSASLRGEPQNDEFKVFRNSPIIIDKFSLESKYFKKDYRICFY